MTACVATAACGVQFTEEIPARVHALPRLAAPQLPAFFRRTAYFAHRHVDAIHGAALAGVQADELRGAAGRFWFCQSSPHFFFGLAGRICRGPLQPASRRDCHPDGGDAPGLYSCGADIDGSDSPYGTAGRLGYYFHRVSRWDRECV